MRYAGTRRLATLCAAALAAVVLALVGAASVAAHADLVSAEPAPGSSLAGSPAVIRLSFSQPLEAASRIDLFTGQFQAVPGLTTTVAGSELRGRPAQPLAPAIYTVQWSAVSDDGHTTSGSYQFAVTRASTPLGEQIVPWVAAGATIVCGALAIFVWILNRRQRL